MNKIKKGSLTTKILIVVNVLFISSLLGLVFAALYALFMKVDTSIMARIIMTRIVFISFVVFVISVIAALILEISAFRSKIY